MGVRQLRGFVLHFVDAECVGVDTWGEVVDALGDAVCRAEREQGKDESTVLYVLRDDAGQWYFDSIDGPSFDALCCNEDVGRVLELHTRTLAKRISESTVVVAAGQVTRAH